MSSGPKSQALKQTGAKLDSESSILDLSVQSFENISEFLAGIQYTSFNNSDAQNEISELEAQSQPPEAHDPALNAYLAFVNFGPCQMCLKSGHHILDCPITLKIQTAATSMQELHGAMKIIASFIEA